MIDLASLVMICQTIHAGGSKVIEAYKKKRFSGAEKTLLMAAAMQGSFHLLCVNEIPVHWVRTGGIDFINTNASDHAYAVKYLEAFRGLCERGYIFHESGQLFMLTDSGFKKARELAAKRNNEDNPGAQEQNK